MSSSILGTLRSFTNDYYSFLLFEFLDSIASSGVYAATFVLGKGSTSVFKNDYKLAVFFFFTDFRSGTS